MGILMKIKAFLWQGLLLSFLLWNATEAQTSYTIAEELKVGSVIGNIAKDLGLQVSEIFGRKLRIASEGGKQYFSVDLGKGELIVSERIDRESICGGSANCVLPLEAIIENPLQLYRVEIEVQDINDNSPVFQNKINVLNIAESTIPGVRFRLESAQDPDVGSNSLRTYTLSKNTHFVLDIKTNKDGSKVSELVLEKQLDREKQSVYSMLLTAVDGGNPARSGTAEITIRVLDNNDNAPVFDESAIDIQVVENKPPGTIVATVKADDRDDGVNGKIVYSFGPHTSESLQNLLTVDSQTGEIKVKGEIDYEKRNSFKLDVLATDKGVPPMQGLCTINVEIMDLNDNSPEIIFKSKPSPVREDAPVGTVVALISAKDIDSGENGRVSLNIPPGLPFKLKPSVSNNYALITDSILDRETYPEYTVEIKASDSGTPSLNSQKTINVSILDVNDNPPIFSQPSYTVYVRENNAAGSIMCSVSATDPDIGENAKICYSILDSKVQDVSVSSYIYINSDNGSIYSMHSFDYEKLKVFQFQVQAKDYGSPSLSSNATVYVFILDENDNAPAVIYPSAVMGSVSHQKMLRSAKAGHLATKISAVDADSGHNAWVSYWLVEATDSSLFSVNLYTGEVRTKRAVSEQDDSSHRLLIEIKDNGDPVQSATVTVNILLEDGLQEPISDYSQKTSDPSRRNSKITFYLIISLTSVSILSLLTFLILVVKCVRNSRSSSSCCIRRADSDGYKNPNRNLQIQLNTDGPIKYVEVLGGDMLSQSQSFRSCLSPMSEFSDFTLVKPSSTTEMINVLDASLPDSAWTFESQQQNPPNNDWRFNQQGQRPGPSGTYRYSTSTHQRWTLYGKARAGPHPERAGGVVAGTGPWPNPPTEAEQIQALMAAANEVSEASATLGPRYNAQFPMQHVPDYRQNVYIPGSTATLTANPQQMMPQQALQGPPQAMPQVDVPNAAQTPASKKKSTKKDKK
uniref:Protocadherin gamma-C3 n=1 Tax=Hucho hucho TaxID=62062 RepID=A0A4W5NC85_9TELE